MLLLPLHWCFSLRRVVLNLINIRRSCHIGHICPSVVSAQHRATQERPVRVRHLGTSVTQLAPLFANSPLSILQLVIALIVLLSGASPQPSPRLISSRPCAVPSVICCPQLPPCHQWCIPALHHPHSLCSVCVSFIVAQCSDLTCK